MSTSIFLRLCSRAPRTRTNPLESIVAGSREWELFVRCISIAKESAFCGPEAGCRIYRGYNRIVIHEILPVGMLQCNCSIFGDEQSREAIVIDPGDDIEKITEVLDHYHLTVKAIVITHAHIDHVAGAHKLRALTGAPVYMNESDRELLNALDVQARWLGVATPARTDVDSAANDGTVLHLGNADFQVIHTPGHTQGSLSIWIPCEEKLVAGDTLFRDSIGRTD